MHPPSSSSDTRYPPTANLQGSVSTYKAPPGGLQPICRRFHTVSSLRRAMEAAEERKMAGLGDTYREGIVFANDEFQDRAVFGGFDIEYEELISTSVAIAEVYMQAAYAFGLRSLFISSWCDGLLTGLMLASLPPTPGAGATDDTGPQG